jgi:parallel beta-helix repeat protein
MTTLNIVDFGASPDLPDNTAIIQVAINDAGLQGDTVYVPSGVFKVDPVRSLLMRSGVVLKIDGTLQALAGAPDKPNALVNLNGVSDISISGLGTVFGERAAHAPGNRAGFCIAAVGSSNITISGLTLRNAWADGIYLQDNKNVTVDGVTCANNGRNGMSIISAETLVVKNSIFAATNSESPMPQAGIDIEPDLPSQSLLNISISGNHFIKNRGAGCYLAFTPQPNRARIFVTANEFEQHYKDGSGPPIGGRNTPLANFLYATCRWVPTYDWWYFPTSFTLG